MSEKSVFIVSINKAMRTALTDTDRLGVVTNLIDAFGDETDDFDDATTAVVRLSEDEWAVVDLSDAQHGFLN
jgi:hypothetical protein